MKFRPQIATGRASCKKCQQVIPKGKPCLELIYSAGMRKNRDKVCLPCLKEIMGEMDAKNDTLSLDDRYIRSFLDGHWVLDHEPTEQEITEFITFLDADIFDWLTENWRSFQANRGD
jgi:hypothetical protein